MSNDEKTCNHKYETRYAERVRAEKGGSVASRIVQLLREVKNEPSLVGKEDKADELFTCLEENIFMFQSYPRFMLSIRNKLKELYADGWDLAQEHYRRIFGTNIDDVLFD